MLSHPRAPNTAILSGGTLCVTLCTCSVHAQSLHYKFGGADIRQETVICVLLGALASFRQLL